MRLRPLWDHDSPVEDVTLLGGDFAGDGSMDLAVVGTREFELEKTMVDSIRYYLDRPDFMEGAKIHDGNYLLRRSFITYFVSSASELDGIMTSGMRDARDAFAAGDVDQAIDDATTARAAAAVLGRSPDVDEITGVISEYVSFPRRRHSLVMASAILAALGLLVAGDHWRRRKSIGPPSVAAAALAVTGVVAWRLLGHTGVNPLLFAGAAIAAGGVVLERTRPDGSRVRRISGAAIEDLIRTLMEFLHGGGEGVPSDGVVDSARKSITRLAMIAGEMAECMDDEERYDMLRERLDVRALDFFDTTYPRVTVLVALARNTRFLLHEVEQLAAAAEMMREGLVVAMRDPAPDAALVRRQLQSVVEGRDALAAAADKAWAIVQTNPGCSLRRGIGRILLEKEEELEECQARVEITHGVPPERDAIALWAFEFRFMLENLVTNALRAMLDSRTRLLTIETSTAGGICSIRISDTGAGMDEETARRVFEARADERGGGFGLANSKRRLLEIGGDIVIEKSAPGEGTTFLLEIPQWRPDTGGHDA
jgi:signal transduction histidine kinase